MDYKKKGCMEGIVRGLEHMRHRPVVDGIVTGIPRKAHLKASPDMGKVAPSATQSSEGVFGAGRTPEGMGDGKGMKIAGGLKKGMKSKREKPSQEELGKHMDAHNA